MGAYAYQTIADDLRRSIADKTFDSGMRLPTTSELCKRYGVSKITVKRAMDELSQEGLVSRKRGSGTFVCESPTARINEAKNFNYAGHIMGFSAECVERGLTPSATVHSITLTQPPAEIAHALGITPREPCHKVERTLLANLTPRFSQVAYLPCSIVEHLTELHAQSSLFAYLEGELGLNIASSHRELRAVVASEAVATRLQIEAGAPVLSVTQTTFLDDGRAVEHSISTHIPGYEYLAIRTY